MEKRTKGKLTVNYRLITCQKQKRLIGKCSALLLVLNVSRFAGELFFYVMSPIPFMLVIAGWRHGLIVGALGESAIYGKSLGELPAV